MVSRSLLSSLLLISTASAFAPGGPSPARSALFSDATDAPPAAAKDSKSNSLSIVPVNDSTVQFTAGTVGTVGGFVVGGPVLAAISGTALNYLSRKDPDGSGGLSSAAQAVGSASQAVLSAYNSVAEFEQENKLIDGALAFVSDKAGDSEVLDTIGGALNSAGDFIEDNDLVGGAGTALASLGDLLETGLDKAVALVEENI